MGRAATEEERGIERKELVTRGLEGYFKELEFYHLFIHLTMMCQRVTKHVMLDAILSRSHLNKTKQIKVLTSRGLCIPVLEAKGATKDF